MIQKMITQTKSLILQMTYGVQLSLFLFSCNELRIETLPENHKIKIDNIIVDGHITGGQIFYFEKDRAYQYNTGYSNLQDSSFVSESTLFQAGALSHQAIALLTLKLAEEDILELDDKISAVYQAPELQQFDAYNSVSYKHLLSHSSGISSWEDEFDFLPDSGWNFSKKGFLLLAKTLEVKLQMPLQELMDNWVFSPLNISNSSFDPDLSSKSIALPHNSYGKPLEPSEGNYTLYTNASDYGKLLIALTKPGFLTSQSLLKIQKTHADAMIWGAEEANEIISWSLGCGLQSNGGKNLLWQWSDEISGSFMMVDPTNDKGLVFLSNSENGFSIADALSDQFFEDEIWFTKWLGLASYQDPGRSERIMLEKAYHSYSQIAANQVYDELNRTASDFLSEAVFNNIVWSLFAEKKLDRSLWLINHHIASDTTSSSAYMRLGEAEGFRQNYQQSWQAYRMAMELDVSLEREILPRFPWYREAMLALQENDSTPIDPQKYLGRYGAIEVSWNGENLLYSDQNLEKIPMVQLSNTTFDLSSLETFRLVFNLEDQEMIGLTQSFLTGERIDNNKASDM